MSASLQQAIPAADVERALEAVLSRAEFRGAGEGQPTLFERLVDWFAGLFGGLPPELADGFGGALMVVLVGVTMAIALALLVRLARLARGAQAEDASRSAEGAARRARVRELLAQAAGARAAGERRAALRLYFLALVVGLSQKGELEYRDAWTYRELLERGQPSPEVQGELCPLQGELDRQLFGGGEISEADLERLTGLCARWLGGADGAGSVPA